MTNVSLIRLGGLAAIFAGILRGINSFIPSDAPGVAVLYLLTDIFILSGVIGIYRFQYQEAGLWGFFGFLLAIVGIITVRVSAVVGVSLYSVGALMFAAGLSLLAVGSWIARKLPR